MRAYRQQKYFFIENQSLRFDLLLALLLSFSSALSSFDASYKRENLCTRITFCVVLARRIGTCTWYTSLQCLLFLSCSAYTSQVLLNSNKWTSVAASLEAPPYANNSRGAFMITVAVQGIVYSTQETTEGHTIMPGQWTSFYFVHSYPSKKKIAVK